MGRPFFYSKEEAMGRLKIKPEDYLVLKEALEKVAKENPGMRREYLESGLSETRYYWDLLWKTGLRIGDGRGNPGDLNLYAYMNDLQLDTALRLIVRRLEDDQSMDKSEITKRRERLQKQQDENGVNCPYCDGGDSAVLDIMDDSKVWLQCGNCGIEFAVDERRYS